MAAQRFSLTFAANAEGEGGKCEGEFTDEEYQAILDYLDQVGVLVRSKPVREGMPCQLKFKFEQGVGLTTETTLPDEDTLSILLHRLRPFILTNEPTSFDRVSGIIGRRVEAEPIRKLLHEQREVYDGREFQRLVKMSTQDGVVNSEVMLQTWLNAHEYHRDPDKQQAVAELFAMLPGDYAQGIFVSMLIDKVRAIRNLAAIAALVIGKTTELTFDLHS
ncbi:MAG: hypothetical protein LLG45_09055 [Actinomycetia bacterium]|nr:hypothetical protein [Actinomycetes bacterium]